MNKIIKKIKENAGFTLVELIVVIAILAILAGVAVPAYSGYITKAEEASDLQVLAAVNTAAMAANATSDDEISCIHVTVASGKIDAILINNVESAEALELAGTDLELTSSTFENGAYWMDGTWTEDQKCSH